MAKKINHIQVACIQTHDGYYWTEPMIQEDMDDYLNKADINILEISCSALCRCEG